MRRIAEQFAHGATDQSGEEINFTPESLARLDGLLGQWLDLAEVYQGDKPDDMTALAVPIGAYVGEVLLRNLADDAIGGRWVTEDVPDQMVSPHVLIGSRIRVNVMKKATDILLRADTPSFASNYARVAELAETERADSSSDREQDEQR